MLRVLNSLWIDKYEQNIIQALEVTLFVNDTESFGAFVITGITILVTV